MTSYFGSVAKIHDPEARFRVVEDQISYFGYRAEDGELWSIYLVPSILRRPDDARHRHLLATGHREDGYIVCPRSWLVTGRCDSEGGFILRGGITMARKFSHATHLPVSTYIQALVADETYRYTCRWAN